MNIDIESMISSYIDEELNSKDKKLFENYMNENSDFLKKVNAMKNVAMQLNNQKIMEPSEKFIDKLGYKISELENNTIINQSNSIYWFGNNLKATLGFSFIIMFMGLIFINTIFISNDELNISDSENLNENSIFLSETDSLKTNENEFPIIQVKGSSSIK